MSPASCCKQKKLFHPGPPWLMTLTVFLPCFHNAPGRWRYGVWYRCAFFDWALHKHFFQFNLLICVFWWGKRSLIVRDISQRCVLISVIFFNFTSVYYLLLAALGFFTTHRHTLHYSGSRTRKSHDGLWLQEKPKSQKSFSLEWEFKLLLVFCLNSLETYCWQFFL